MILFSLILLYYQFTFRSRLHFSSAAKTLYVKAFPCELYLQFMNLFQLGRRTNQSINVYIATKQHLYFSITIFFYAFIDWGYIGILICRISVAFQTRKTYVKRARLLRPSFVSKIQTVSIIFLHVILHQIIVTVVSLNVNYEVSYTILC